MGKKINPHDILLESIRLTVDNIQFAAPILLFSLMMSIAPIAYRTVAGNTDSETFGTAIALAMIIINSVLYFGLACIAIETARGRVATWDMFRMPAEVYIQVAAVGIVCGIAIVAGFLFFIIPGVILALMWSQVYCLIIDRKAQWFESVSLSKQLTEGNKMSLLELFFRIFVISLPVVILGILIMKLSLPDVSNLPKDAVPEMIHTPLTDTLNIIYSILGALLQVFNTFVSGNTYQKLLAGHESTDSQALTA
jgi:hypothetical protein